MNKYIIISTTTKSKEEANKISEILLKKRLVSCCQLFNLTSAYWWEGKIEHADEILIQMKTRKEHYKEIEETILDNHSYEIPEIFACDIADGYKGYLDWINKETEKEH